MSTIATGKAFETLFKRAGIEITEELEKVLKTENLSEIPVTFWNQLSPMLLGKKGAANDPDVYNQVRKKVATKMESEFDAAFGQLGFEYGDLIGQPPSTFQERLSAFAKLDGRYAEKYKKDGSDAGKSREAIEQLQKQLADSNKAIDALKSQHATQLHGVQVDGLVAGELAKYELAGMEGDAANQFRAFLGTQVRGKAHFKLENGSVKLFNRENPELLLMDNNDVVTLDKLVQNVVAPYVKKSEKKPHPINGGGNGDGGHKKFEPRVRG